MSVSVATTDSKKCKPSVDGKSFSPVYKNKAFDMAIKEYISSSLSTISRRRASAPGSVEARNAYMSLVKPDLSGIRSMRSETEESMKRTLFRSTVASPCYQPAGSSRQAPTAYKPPPSKLLQDLVYESESEEEIVQSSESEDEAADQVIKTEDFNNDRASVTSDAGDAPVGVAGVLEEVSTVKTSKTSVKSSKSNVSRLSSSAPRISRAASQILILESFSNKSLKEDSRSAQAIAKSAKSKVSIKSSSSVKGMTSSKSVGPKKGDITKTSKSGSITGRESKQSARSSDTTQAVTKASSKNSSNAKSTSLDRMKKSTSKGSYKAFSTSSLSSPIQRQPTIPIDEQRPGSRRSSGTVEVGTSRKGSAIIKKEEVSQVKSLCGSFSSLVKVRSSSQTSNLSKQSGKITKKD